MCTLSRKDAEEQGAMLRFPSAHYVILVQDSLTGLLSSCAIFFIASLQNMLDDAKMRLQKYCKSLAERLKFYV